MSTTPTDCLINDALRIGVIIDGRYEITGLIGEGGSAEVYRARQLNINREVAVKILHVPTTSKAARRYAERFLREARVVARIEHPGIVTVYDYGVYDGRQPYIVLELLRGRSLEDGMADGIPLARALDLMKSALGALNAAHKMGIVHRDLKPGNLFLTTDENGNERLKILDFGLAFPIEQIQERLTQAGHVNGTPQYVSPEYLERQIVTPALDVYQMGLILVEMLTGRPVIEEDSPYACFVIHCSGVLPIPDWVRETSVGPIVDRATRLEHTERYADAAEFLAALEALGDDDINQLRATQAKRRHEAAPERPSPLVRATQPPDLSPAPAESLTSMTIPPIMGVGFQEYRNVALIAGVAAVALVVLGLFAGLFVMLTGEDDVEPTMETVRIEGSALDVDASGAGSEVDVDASDPKPTVEPSKVEIAVVPKRAKIFVGDQLLGKGSAAISFAPGALDAVEVRVEAPGYETQTVSVKPGADPVSLRLQGAKRGAVAAKPPKPAKPTAGPKKPLKGKTGEVGFFE